MVLALAAMVVAQPGSISFPAVTAGLTQARLDSGALEIRLRCHGRDEWFELDSGSPTSYLYGKTGKSQDFALSLSGRVLATVHPATDDAPAGAPDGLAGLLGADFLHQVVLGVDATSGVAALWTKPAFTETSLNRWLGTVPAPPGGKTSAISLTTDRDGLPVIPDFHFGPVSVAALLDTGTGFCLLPKKTMEQMPRYPLVPMSMQGWSSVETANAFLISKVSAGAWSESFPMVLTMDGEDDDPIVGENVLGSLTWVLDLSGRMLWIRPANEPAESGAELTLPRNAKLHVRNAGWDLRLPHGFAIPPGSYPVVRFGRLNIADATGPDVVRTPGELDAAFEARELTCYGDRAKRLLLAFQTLGAPADLEIWVSFAGKQTKISFPWSELG